MDPTRSLAFTLALIEAAPDAIVVADAKGRVLLWNAQAEAEKGPEIRLSIGAATAEDASALGDCLRRAGEAMYRDKLARTGRVRLSGEE